MTVKFGAIVEPPANAQSPAQSRERKRAVSREERNTTRSQTWLAEMDCAARVLASLVFSGSFTSAF
jgi:hypothetical protein